MATDNHQSRTNTDICGQLGQGFCDGSILWSEVLSPWKISGYLSQLKERCSIRDQIVTCFMHRSSSFHLHYRPQFRGPTSFFFIKNEITWSTNNRIKHTIRGKLTLGLMISFQLCLS